MPAYSIDVVPCLVYECMDNGSLDNRLQCEGATEPLSAWQRLRCARDIACGLSYLHNTAKLAHCDVKAANVLFDASWCAKLGDFGLVKRVHGPEGLAKESGMYLQGTAPYVAPEVHQGRLSVDVDMYAMVSFH